MGKMYIKNGVLYVEKTYINSFDVLCRREPETKTIIETYTKNQLEKELDEIMTSEPVFDVGRYEAGNDGYFYELEARDERIQELNKMLSMF